jgi:hypothetical protein
VHDDSVPFDPRTTYSQRKRISFTLHSERTFNRRDSLYSALGIALYRNAVHVCWPFEGKHAPEKYIRCMEYTRAVDSAVLSQLNSFNSDAWTIKL